MPSAMGIAGSFSLVMWRGEVGVRMSHALDLLVPSACFFHVPGPSASVTVLLYADYIVVPVVEGVFGIALALDSLLVMGAALRE
jgi:hypothetical protein